MIEVECRLQQIFTEVHGNKKDWDLVIDVEYAKCMCLP